jgi:hypothetical protein
MYIIGKKAKKWDQADQVGSRFVCLYYTELREYVLRRKRNVWNHVFVLHRKIYENLVLDGRCCWNSCVSPNSHAFVGVGFPHFDGIEYFKIESFFF